MALFRRPPSEPPDPPWDVLGRTGNGIGRAPASLRKMKLHSDDDFEEVLYGELYDRFLHQGTIYAATPFAVAEVVDVLSEVKPRRQAELLHWCRACLKAEALGEVGPCLAGVWLPPKDLKTLHRANVPRMTVEQILTSKRQQLEALAWPMADPRVLFEVQGLLAELP